LFVFLVLYNLRLLELGFREDTLGRVAGAFSLGSLAGALPAGVALQRLGLKRTVRVCFAGLAAASIVRSLGTSEPLLLAAAFFGGLAMSLWAVAIPPAVTQLTSERSRPLGFSVVFGVGIGIGVLGGLAGGRLPEWIARLGAAGAMPPKQAALLVACASMLAAVAAAGRLRFGREVVRKRAVFPRSGFVVRFLAVLAVWSAATGAFNPFFNTYFAVHLRAPVERVGSIFAASQFAQMAAVLCAPALLRRAGLIKGIALTQLAAAGGLAVLAACGSGTAAFAYAAYMSLQYMSEPGMYSLLMSRVREEERGGASSMNFFVIFSAQSVAAAAAGTALTRFGYPAVLGAAAVVAALAGTLFPILLRGSDRRPA
jgi:MFS family permease